MQIVIADDHPLYREALSARIARIFPKAAIFECGTLFDVRQLADSSPDSERLFLLDFDMPGMSVGALKSVVDQYPGTVVAVISGAASNSDARAAIGSGARGFIPKTATGTYLSHALQLLLSGGTSAPAEIVAEPNERQPVRSAPVASAAWISALTKRETDVLRLLTRGLSNKQIGRELDLAEVTIKLHLTNVYRKIGAATRSEAAVLATKANFPNHDERHV